MLREITLPAFGSSVGEASIVQWFVTPGSAVEAGQVIAEIETDKAMADLEAPEGGVIEAIEVAEGTEGVATGTVLAHLRVLDQGSEAESAPSETVPSTREDFSMDKQPAAAKRQHQPSRERQDRIKASPLARKLAKEQAVDLRGISGSGPDGRVVSRDLENVDGARSAAISSILGAMGYEPDSYKLIPLARMRRAIAAGLQRSVQEIPHYSLTADLQFDAVLDHRKTLRASRQNDAVQVSVNDYVLWACAQALRDVPAVNSSWTDEGTALHCHANIAVAVAIDEGLVAPVIHAAECMTLNEIATASQAAIQRARDRLLKPPDLMGATFSVSNLGMMGIRSFTSILSRPQACILSVGAIEARPVVRNGEIVIARVATCTLTCDHRVVDGAVGARFIQKLDERLQSLLA